MAKKKAAAKKKPARRRTPASRGNSSQTSSSTFSEQPAVEKTADVQTASSGNHQHADHHSPFGASHDESEARKQHHRENNGYTGL